MMPYARLRLPNQPVYPVYLGQRKGWLAMGSIYALTWGWMKIKHYIVPSVWVLFFITSIFDLLYIALHPEPGGQSWIRLHNTLAWPTQGNYRQNHWSCESPPHSSFYPLTICSRLARDTISWIDSHMVGQSKNFWRHISRISVLMHVSGGTWRRKPTRRRTVMAMTAMTTMTMMRRRMQGMMRMRRRQRRLWRRSRNRRQMNGLEVKGGVWMMMMISTNSSILANSVWFFWYDFNYNLANAVWFFYMILTIF